MVNQQTTLTISRHVAAYGIRETSIPQIVRACGLRAAPGQSLRGFQQMIGEVLRELGFAHYRASIDGVREYRYKRGDGVYPPAQPTPPLSEIEVFSHVPGTPSRDPYSLAPPKPLPELRKRRSRFKDRDRFALSLYLTRAFFQELASNAIDEGLSQSAYAATVLRMAVPHCPPGSVRAAYDAHNAADAAARASAPPVGR